MTLRVRVLSCSKNVMALVSMTTRPSSQSPQKYPVCWMPSLGWLKRRASRYQLVSCFEFCITKMHSVYYSAESSVKCLLHVYHMRWVVINCCAGHSTGTLKDGERAVRAGANFITHLFNAMLPVSVTSHWEFMSIRRTKNQYWKNLVLYIVVEWCIIKF